jgi:3,4-dihydroxy 2-butanone 4-phosphate synthase/GTP cyclohydrolase II
MTLCEIEKPIYRISQARLSTDYGVFTAMVYTSKCNPSLEHMVLVKGEVQGKNHILVRVHSECLTGDVFNSRRCDCGSQLKQSMKYIQEEGTGVILYLKGHEGRGIGLGNKLQAYFLQDHGQDTVDANLALGLPVDARDYKIAAQILADLGLDFIRLLTNNPSKKHGIERNHINVAECIPLIAEVHAENFHYLLTKKNKMGHLI